MYYVRPDQRSAVCTFALLFLAQSNQDTAITWVRAHVQIPGNEEADALANWGSHLGETAASTRTVTEGGIRARGKRERAEMRRREGFRLGTATEWNRQALSAYTWMRTGKGPQKQWLHHIGRADNPYCPCDPDTIQSGEHITFKCPLHTRARRTLIANRRGECDPHRWKLPPRYLGALGVIRLHKRGGYRTCV